VLGLDDRIAGLGAGGSLVVLLLLALLLGLRHATDPDHLTAVSTLVMTDRLNGTRRAGVLGLAWGLGHAATLVLLGLPLIAFKSSLPGWLERGAERAVGVVIVLLALRVILKWARGDYRADSHPHRAASPRDVPGGRAHRHLRRHAPHGHRSGARTPRQALGIGFLHGLAGTGAIVLLLLAALPTRLEAALSLAVFAPMSIFSMAACTTAFAWVLTRPVVEPFYRSVLIPSLGLFGVAFGLWYTGI
jgi:ABC-type nickel/cobalt efflux system permease component RcnA